MTSANGDRETRDDSLAGRGKARFGRVLAILGSIGLVPSIVGLFTGILIGARSIL